MIPLLKANQFAKLKPEWIKELSEDQAKRITAIQAKHMTADQFKKLKADNIEHLQVATFKELRATECIANLSQGQTEKVTGDQAAAMTEDQFKALKPEVFSKVTQQAFKRLSANDCIAHISQAQAQKLTSGQMVTMTQQQFAQFPSDRIGDIPANTFVQLQHLAQITADQAAGLRYEQLSRINSQTLMTIRTKWKYLRPPAYAAAFGALGNQSASQKYQEVLAYLKHNIGHSGAQCLRGADFEGGTRYFNNDGTHPLDLQSANRWYITSSVLTPTMAEAQGDLLLVCNRERHGMVQLTSYGAKTKGKS